MCKEMPVPYACCSGKIVRLKISKWDMGFAKFSP
jgi:hypothetical protein